MPLCISVLTDSPSRSKYGKWKHFFSHQLSRILSTQSSSCLGFCKSQQFAFWKMKTENLRQSVPQISTGCIVLNLTTWVYSTSEHFDASPWCWFIREQITVFLIKSTFLSVADYDDFIFLNYILNQSDCWMKAIIISYFLENRIRNWKNVNKMQDIHLHHTPQFKLDFHLSRGIMDKSHKYHDIQMPQSMCSNFSSFFSHHGYCLIPSWKWIGPLALLV